MRQTAWISVLCAAGAACVLTACGGGGDTTSSSGAGGSGGATASSSSGTGGKSSSSSSSSSGSSSSSASGSSASSSASGSSSSGGGNNLLNGCDPKTAEDQTNKATVQIQFGGNVGLKYSPPCIVVSPKTAVTFSGSFLSHPLDAGEVKNGTPMPDKNSPIKPTVSGTMATFTLDATGAYPYFCDDHYSAGMQGAIFVK